MGNTKGLLASGIVLAAAVLRGRGELHENGLLVSLCPLLTDSIFKISSNSKEIKNQTGLDYLRDRTCPLLYAFHNNVFNLFLEIVFPE